MSRVIAEISMSLDGYVTARGAGQEHGLGIGGEGIQGWVLAEPRSPVDQAVLTHSFEETGAVVMGRRLYDIVDRARTSSTRAWRRGWSTSSASTCHRWCSARARGCSISSAR
jgi:dihydrofolate reductase